MEKASKVKELNEADKIEGSVTLGKTEGKEDTSGPWKLKPWPSQTTAGGPDKAQVPAERKVVDPCLSTAKLRPWDRPTPLLKLEKAPARTKEKLNHPDGKTLLEIRKQARTAPPVRIK